MGDVAEHGEQIHESGWLDVAIRVGLVAYGLVHLVIGWLAAQLALGESSGKASSSGALHEIAEQPLGGVLVWAVAGGMSALVVWRLLEALYGVDDDADAVEEWRDRAKSLLKAAIYAAVAWSAVKTAVGNGSSGGTDSATASLMNLPGGQVIVGVIGLAIVAYGAGQFWSGWTERFTKHLDAEAHGGADGAAYRWFGKVGYIAKGVAITIVGGLFCYAALTHRARESGGLDKALQTVRDQPLGQVLLLVIAVGLSCYGLFCLARARHLRR